MREKRFPFRESDVRLHYKLMNHTYLSELRLLQRGMYPVCRIVKDEDSFVSLCRQWNGKRNIYVGLRDRRRGLRSCARSEDIVGLQAVVLDIDPHREPEIPSTKCELASAIETAEKIRKWFTKNDFEKPALAITGNGCCLYFFLPFLKIGEKNRFKITRNIENFECWVRNNFKNYTKRFNCVVDRMYDLPRIIRVIGTYNIKGEATFTRPHRLSYWFEKPKTVVRDNNLLKFILNL